MFSTPLGQDEKAPGARGWRQAFTAAVFGLWGGGIVFGLGVLGRERCEAENGTETARITQVLSAGWRVRYWLSPEGAAGPALAALLAQRGPLPAGGGEVCVVGETGALANRIEAAGWTVRRSPGKTATHMEVFAPDGVLRWSGPFRGLDAKADDEVALDLVVLEKVARGEAAPPFVPMGCVVKLPRVATVVAAVR